MPNDSEIILSNMTFDPKNGAANFSYYKQTNAPGALPGVNINVKIEFQDGETIGQARQQAAKAAAELLREVIKALEKQV